MTVESGPNIVNDGLSLYLDASNIKSYPGSGTSWNDLSGAHNATMHGSVPIETDVVPCFNFATVTSSIASGNVAPGASMGFTFASNMVTTSGDFTISVWVKNSPPNSSQSGLFSNAGAGNGFRFGAGLNGIYYLIGPDYKEGTINFLSTVSSSVWHNIVAVFSRSTLSIIVYLNGILQNSASIPSPQTAFTNTAPGIVRSSCCSLYTGKLSQIAVYNKALTATEISNNFNAARGRYGI